MLLASTRPAEAAHSSEPEEVLASINGGWPKHIRALSLDPERNYVVVAMSPPSSALDLRSAENFRETLIGAHWAKATIGHTMVGWQCRNNKGESVRGFTGITGESSGQSEAMAKSGWGATAFISTFTDGKLQNPAAVEAALDLAQSRGREINVVVLEVSAESCAKSAEFMAQFVRHPQEPLFRFGLTVRPERFEGGGCGSLAVTVVDQAGFWNSISRYFWRTLAVPKSFMGRRLSSPPPNVIPNFPWADVGDVEVPLNVLQESRWEARPGEQSLRVDLVDPEMMLLMTRTLRALARESGQSEVRTPIQLRTARLAVPFETHDGERPKVGYYYRWVRIDESFDAQAANVVEATKGWAREAIRDGYRLIEFAHPHLVGVRLERARSTR